MRIAALIITIIALLDLARGTTVLEALEMVPKDDLGSLARIEAFDGTPVPERWHILVYDPESETGVKEYVVAKGELVTSRGISQFAETLRPTDVIGKEPVKIDSDKLADVAKEYAEANDMEFATMSYHIARQQGDAKPSWRVDCRDGEGKVLGSLMVNAETGDVLSHEGFAEAPSVKKEKSKASRTARADSDDSPRVKTRSRSRSRDPEPVASRERTRSRGSSQRERSRSSRPEVRRAEPVANSRGVGRFMRRLFNPRD
jgi:hypothetical protein